MKKTVFCLLALCSSLSALARVNIDQLQAAAKAHNVGQITKQLESAQGDILEPYARYYLLNAKMDSLSEAEANEFLSHNADTLLAERFRADWLKELGQRQQWQVYLVEYPRLENPTKELQCYAAWASYATGNKEALLTAKPLWFYDNNLPSSCNPVFETLFSEGKLNQEDLWLRIRMALASDHIDFAGQLADNSSVSNSISTKTLRQIRLQPQVQLSKIDTNSRAGREIAIYALNRLARTSPDTAAAWLAKQDKWPASELHAGWQQIAEFAVRRQHPMANQWFANGGMAGLDADSRAWAIRAALRSQDWKAVNERIEALPAAERQSNSWRYWQGRALRALGHNQEAGVLWGQIAQDSGDYYGLLAREELGMSLELPNIQYRASENEVRNMGNLPGIRRAIALMEQNARLDAIREWNWAMRNLSDQQLLAAAEFARRMQWYDRAIYAAERTRQLHDPSARYMAPYRDITEQQSRSNGLEAAWVYGVMRQESRFMASIRSGAGAMGLMQLMPATAKWIAQKIGLTSVSPANITDVSTNVALGTGYLQHIWHQLSDNQVLATAGYNAGPGRARAWQEDKRMDATIYIETIPFDETRDYVKRVMTNATHYALVFNHGQTSLKKRLGTIPARGGEINAP